MDWQLIETAPKSTSADVKHGKIVTAVFILGYVPGEFSGDPKGNMAVIWWEPNIKGGCWVHDGGENIKPTHWTSLPEPPQ